MSYPYPHGSHGQQGQYHDDYSTPSTPQYPQWEVLDPQSQQQLEPEVLTPTQQMHTPQQLFAPPPSMPMDTPETHYIPSQHSPVEPPPALLHRHSYEATSEGSPVDVSNPPRPATSTSQSQQSQLLRRAPPLRRSPSSRSKNRPNPYPRPHSAMGDFITTPVAGSSGRLQRVEEAEAAGGRYISVPPRITTSTSISSSSAGPSTAVATSPASAPGQIMSHGPTFSGASPYTPSTMLPPTTPIASAGGILQRQVQGGIATTGEASSVSRGRRYIIRSDIQYDPQTHVLTASMELPGVKKTQLSVTLSTCLINRVKQVVVSGRTSPVFPPPTSSVHFNVGGDPATGSSLAGVRDGSGAVTSSSGGGGGAVSEHDGTQLQHNVRERRYGEFTRTLPVPAETKLEDIDAAMEDGVLTLKICLGNPAESADVQVVPIR
uniref:SHSP domain-containing protein n=1 Tax=Moniliophthora roreri TaxID=221103 RepID=A0A0W0EZR7_MONRR